MANETEAEVVRDLATQAAGPTHLQPGHQYAWITRDGAIVERDLTNNVPAFKEGTVTVRDVESFGVYFDKHADDDSEVFADLDGGTITAVLDAHHSEPETGARWQQHRLVLALKPTLPWVTWTQRNRQPMSQIDFADFLEDNRRDLHPEGEISAADFLELAQSFQASTRLDFESAERLDSGQVELLYKETGEAKAGRSKRIEIPTEFTLAIKPYEDCDTEQIRARFRYRVNGTTVTFLYVLDNPQRHAQDAVKEIVAKATDRIGDRAIMLGQPDQG